MNKKTALLMLLLFLNSGTAHSGETLIASGHTEYPPFMWKEGDKIIGVGPELTTKIFGELGISVDSKYVGPWKRVQHLAEIGKIDVIVGIYKTESRLEFLAFPEQHYTRDPVVLFVKKGGTITFTEWKDLIGKKGGATLGDSFGQEFDAFAKENLSIQRVKKIGQSFKMIDKNRIDYMIYGLYPGRIKAIELGLEDQIIYLPKFVTAPRAYQAFSKKSEFRKHLAYFDQRIAELKADGTIKKMIEKYMAHWEKTLGKESRSKKLNGE